MSGAPGSLTLKRAKTTQDASIDPLSIVHVALGYLGVLYECQLVYVRYKLDKVETPERDLPLVPALESAHALAIEVISRFVQGEPVDPSLFPELLEANRRTIESLAAEGRDLLNRLGAGSEAP